MKQRCGKRTGKENGFVRVSAGIFLICNNFLLKNGNSKLHLHYLQLEEAGLSFSAKEKRGDN